MFFLLPGSELLFSLLGVGMASWLVGAGAKSFVGSLSNTPPKLETIELVNKKSKSGKCFVKNYGFYKPLKKYVAEVVCPELSLEMMEVANTKERLEELIKIEFEYLEEKL